MKPEANSNLYTEIRTILAEARQSAYRAVNFAMVVAYWEIGKGYSLANLKNFRQFYLTFSEGKSDAVRRKSETGQKSSAQRSQFEKTKGHALRD